MIKFWAGATACLVGLCAGYGLASRNSSGTMAAINGPYTAGTVISSSVINARLADIETELTDSKSRSGKGDFSAPVRAADGTVTAPAFAFTSETGTGLYRIGSSDLGVAINQSKKLELTSSLFTMTPDSLFSGKLGVGVSPLWKLHVQLASSGATAIASTSAMIESNGTHFLNLLAPNANSSGIAFGDVSSPSNGYIEYKNSTNASANQMQFGAAGSTRFIISGSGVMIGSSGTAIATVSAGSCTLNGGTPATCTATVVSGAKCVASKVQTGGGTAQSVSVTTTTLTVTSAAAGDTAVANYFCWI